MSDAPRRRRGRGGQGGHDPRARIRTRELRAMELAVQGWSQPQIAADLGISQAAVSKLLKRIEGRLLRELAETVQRQKARQTLRLDYIFAEAARAWHASKADTTRRRQRQTHGGAGAGATVAELVVENQHGDPRYLDEARKALADQRKLWGLDAPQKVDLRASRDPYDDMTEDALRAELARQKQLLAATPTVIEPGTTDTVTSDDAADSTPSTSSP
jgi:DNA-binding CsgD family transcriptional regulator